MGFENMTSDLKELLTNSGKIIEISNPERQLKHGYSIVKVGEKIVKNIKQVEKGDELDIMVSDGIIKTITQ